MALSTYAELQTAIQTELVKTDATFTTAIPDMIKRAESKMNRQLRLRNMETQSTATYEATNTTRRIAMPNGSNGGPAMLEMIDMQIKRAAQDDDDYWVLRQVSSFNLPEWYKQEYPVVYAWRNDIEFNTTVTEDHTVKMHYIGALDIATDTTNWVLTNYPDTYLYGSLMESEVFWMRDERAPMWKRLFEEAITQANETDSRSRNDAELSNRTAVRMAGGRGIFNITNTAW